MTSIIPKDILNVIRGMQRENVKQTEIVCREEAKDIESVFEALNSGVYGTTKKAVIHIREKYGIIGSLSAPRKSIIDALNDRLERNKKHIEISKSIMSSVSNNGPDRVIYSFPIFFTVITCNMPHFNYLAVRGIKYNGEHEKTNSRYMDDVEIKLHEYEKMMAKLINDDISISTINQGKFMDLFTDYVDYFVKSGKCLFDLVTNARDEALAFMREYLSYNVDFVNSLIASQQETENNHKKTENIQHGDLQILLKSESDVQDEIISSKELYRKKQEEALRMRYDLLEELGFDNWSELYDRARTSDNAIATEAIKNIDFWLDWLISGEEDLRQELIDECAKKFALLEEIFRPESQDKSNISYFKISRDGETYPAIMESIAKMKKGEYRAIESSINKLISGNVYGREVQGDLPITVFATYSDFKIFYTIINGVVIVIDGFTGDKGYSKIPKIVSSSEFLGYYQTVKAATQDGRLLPSEQAYTDMIRSTLAKGNMSKNRQKANPIVKI